MRRSAILGFVLAGVACTAQTPTVDPSRPPTGATTTVRPTRTALPPKVPVRAAVIQDGTIILYEVAGDSTRPLVAGTGISQLSWLSGTELALAQAAPGGATIRILDARTAASSDALAVSGRLLDYDFDPQRSAIAVLVADDEHGFVEAEVHYLVGDRAIQRMAVTDLVGREPGLETQFAAEFSPDGERILFVQTENPDGEGPTAPLQVRGRDGVLEYWVDADRAPTAATWLPDGTLMFRSRDGVRRWKPGRTSSSSIDGLSSWYAPWPAASGRHVAFDSGRTSTSVRVRRLNLANGRVVDVGPAGRAHPVYAAHDEIWVQIAQRCTPRCPEPVVLGPVVSAIDLATGRERRLSLPTLEGLALWSETP